MKISMILVPPQSYFKKEIFIFEQNFFRNIVKNKRSLHPCHWCYDRKLMINHFNRSYHNIHFAENINQLPSYKSDLQISRITKVRPDGSITRLSPREQEKFSEKQEVLKVHIWNFEFSILEKFERYDVHYLMFSYQRDFWPEFYKSILGKNGVLISFDYMKSFDLQDYSFAKPRGHKSNNNKAGTTTRVVFLILRFWIFLSKFF